MAIGVVSNQALPPHVQRRRDKRQAALKRLGFDSYAGYLKSPEWRALRARYRASDLPQACICESDEVHLHHMTYDRVGAERLTDLTPLCANCHALIHVLERRGDVGLDFEGFFNAGRAEEGRAILAQMAEQQRGFLKKRLREQQSELRAMTFAARLLKAKRHADRERHVNISGHIFVLKQMIERGKSNEVLTRRLRVIEEVVYGWEGWA
jgi:hypothetical protein